MTSSEPRPVHPFAVLAMVLPATFLLIALDPAGLDWRAVFYVNVPIGLAAMIAAARGLPESRAPEGRRLDLAGAALVTAGLFLLVFPLTEGRESGWPAWIFAMLAGSAAVAHPVLRPAAAEDPAGRVAAGLHDPLPRARLSPRHRAGGARLVDHPVLLPRLLALPPGRLPLHGAPRRAHHLAVLDRIGLGLVMAPMTTTILGGIQSREVGSASGVLSTGQQIGGALGVSVIGVLFFASLLPSGLALARRVSYAHAFQHALLYPIVCLAICTVITLLLPRPRDQRPM